MIEKRKSPRVPVSIKVESGPIHDNFIFGYARDISSTGISISSEIVSSMDAIPNIGDKLTLSFKLPKSDHKITVLAELVRVDLSEGELPVLGLTYTEIQQESKVTINHYVSQTQMKLFA
ncbi:MAG: PilZ domain-containing protein [Bdellovibrionota bacterium]|nr:PilZ domain-containing protein [Deltaproteobacteria bacterium]